MGSRLTVEKLLLGQSGPAFAKVTAVVHSAEGVQVDGHGVRSPDPEAKGDYYLLLVRQNDHWVVNTFRGNVKPIT